MRTGHVRRARTRGEEYEAEHAASLARRMEEGSVRPRTFGQLIRWFEDRWSDETPERVHTRGVWRDRVSPAEADRGLTPVGGSLIGAPQLSDPFRRLMDSSPFETQPDVHEGRELSSRHYVRPVRAAIARLGMRFPFAARWLSALGYAGCDWRALATRRCWTEEEAQHYLSFILDLLYREYEVAPTTGH